MADKIKQFFQKKKVDAKFKRAGKGYKLTDEQPRSNTVTPKSSVPTTSRSALSAEASQAAAAAMARLGGQKLDSATAFTSLAAIQAQVRKELEAEKKAASAAAKEEEEEVVIAQQKLSSEVEASPHLAVNGVYFKCPLISDEILSKEEWTVKIKEFLYSQLEEERGLTSCLIIHSCNKNREKIAQCVETLCKYLENIVQNPTEDKYKKIRMSNRIFQERVAPIEGIQDFLMAAGFEIKKEEFQGSEEDYLVFSEQNVESLEYLSTLCDALRSAEPISLELDRNLQVLLPSQATHRTDLPPVFYTMTPEELKKEQQLRAETIEKSMMLRTKAMREKDELREMKKYRYALIRVRFPDGILLQGTFHVYEKFDAVLNFVTENLVQDDQPFILIMANGCRLSHEEANQTLVDLRLVPASVLIFSWDTQETEEKSVDQQAMYLKPEVMLLVQAV
ncbi:UBX domain-containing protein 6 [Schistocerca americana]|uniref:UBX domain-containing protein 6 n=1 Tax=Schistocerca americana TaxID=7009 RepID=UPI001F5027E4|nr:UBX domain-containing protein 6 [Schistocerca americana]